MTTTRFSPRNIPLFFFGTPSFALSSIEMLIAEGYDIRSIFTQPDKPVGRKKILTPSPVKILAESKDIPVIQPISLKNEGVREIFLHHTPVVGIVVAYGKIIPDFLLELAPKGFINVHPSLLPKYRGPSPIASVILHGENKTGVTTMLLDREMDHGPIFLQKTCPISPSDTTCSLEQKLARVGSELLKETLEKYLQGKLFPKSQNHEAATYCHLLKRKDGIVTANDTAEQIHNKVRALAETSGVFLTWKGSVYKIHNTNLVSQLPIKQALHELFTYQNKLYLMATDQPLEIIEIQPENKKRMAAQEFLHGYIRNQ